LPDTQDINGWLSEEWLARLASSVEMMTEAPPELKPGSRIPASAAPADTLWVSIPLNLAGNTAVFVGAPEASWLGMGESALQAAGVAAAGPDDARSTYLEIISQATSGLAQTISMRVGKPVATLAPQEGLLPSADLTPVEISLHESPIGRLYVGWSKELELALAPPDAPIAAPRESIAPDKRGLEKSRTFDLLMEVELPVSVSFGRAQLPLRDVLKLTSGSIVELNRTISDPVEIIVNNCVIARGEVVVIEGNYGVRIQHVISREERLRTLK
jgi:flagellar motor switch protein FliN/FliY